MKVRLLLGIILLATIARPAVPQQTPERLSKDQVMQLVKAGMDPGKLSKLIREHGIDFDLTDDYLQALRAAKAPDAVIQALSAVRPPPLNKEKVLALAASSLPSGRAASLVEHRGISFLADDEYLKTLRLAGADEALVAAVRAASDEATAELEVVTSPNAGVYVDDQLEGHADTQGELAIKSAFGSHELKVSMAGKKDFHQSISLAAKQTTKIEARLEDRGPIPGVVVGQYPYQAVAASSSPLVAEARAKSADCMTIVNIWNSKMQQAMSNPVRDPSRRGAMAGQMNDINQERVATYRSKLMPQLKDLQQKLLAGIGHTSGEHLDYEMVQSAMQLIGVCTDLNQLSSQYQMSLLQPKQH